MRGTQKLAKAQGGEGCCHQGQLTLQRGASHIKAAQAGTGLAQARAQADLSGLGSSASDNKVGFGQQGKQAMLSGVLSVLRGQTSQESSSSVTHQLDA